jgi:3-phosphoshikimate 1-carboxyvinyltransferase
MATPVYLPASKSVAARALICKEVLKLDTTLVGLPDCDDTRELYRALDTLRIAGNQECVCDLGSGAASLRFFVALAASMPDVKVKVVCSPQLQKRPLLPLLNALHAVGADIECPEKDGFPPLYIKGKQLKGGVVKVDASISSQFASALLMASQLWSEPFTPDFGGVEPVSAPYLKMTENILAAMKQRPASYKIEADWSAASYFFEYALIHPGSPVEVANLDINTPSLQGDAKCLDLFRSVGVSAESRGEGAMLIGDETRISELRNAAEPLIFNMEDTPDLVPAFAFALCFAGIRFRFVGVNHLRHKESDRIATVSEELFKAGYRLTSGDNYMEWNGAKADGEEGREKRRPISFDSHGDHRIAMSVAVLQDLLPGMTIENAGVVTKSFPDFYTQLATLISSLLTLNSSLICKVL